MPSSSFFMGVVNEFPFSSQGPMEGNAQILQVAERNAAYFGKFKHGYLVSIAPSSATWNLQQFTDKSGGKWDEFARQVHRLPKGRPQARRQKHALQRRTSANDICMLFGMCAFLGHMKQDDLESLQDSASIVLAPRVSELVSLSRALVADDLSDFSLVSGRKPLSTSINS